MICVKAEYNGQEGEYCLGMTLHNDTAILFGREVMGEPKKIGVTTFVVDGDTITANVNRYGVDILKVNATKMGPMDTEIISNFTNFHFKYTYAADGSGLDHDPFLVAAAFTNTADELFVCDATIELGKSDYDVYGEIPMLDVIACLYTPNANMYPKTKYLTTVDKTEFLPYAFCKIDPYDLIMGEV